MGIDIDVINKAFGEMISTRNIFKKLKITSNDVRQLRFRFNADNNSVLLDTKMSLLQRSGWRQDQGKYTQIDLVNAVKFALRQAAAAKEQGAEYLVEKFLMKK